MATFVVGLHVTCPFYLIFFFKISKVNIYCLYYKNTLYPSRDWVIVNLRQFRKYLGRNVCWK